jgi:NDP-sugar pyrophosphorylase family protein
MQAVILAAGKGTRMLPLTLTTPKPLLMVAGKPILERILDVLPTEIDEVILVVGYMGDAIQKHFSDTYKGMGHDIKITYVWQSEPKGTYDALLTARETITGKFLVLVADDLHGAAALAEAITYPLALIVSEHDDPTKFGAVQKDAEGNLESIIEHPTTFEQNLVSTAAMVLDDRIFKYEVLPAPNGELQLPVALHQLAQEFPVHIVEQSEWTPLGYPEDIERYEAKLAS